MTLIHPAATVLTIREHPQMGVQVLLLKRNSKLTFAPDFWVFPGGRIDQEDGPTDQGSIHSTAKIAAVRETREEAGLNIMTNDLHHYCHWTTPKGGKKRFATWFFHCCVAPSNQNVTIDGSEIVAHLWASPSQALADMSTCTLALLPPTFISLARIRNASSYAEVISEFDRTGVVQAAPVTIVSGGLFYCLYKGDAGYEAEDINRKGPRHRLIIDQVKRKHHFEYEDCFDYPPVNGGISL